MIILIWDDCLDIWATLDVFVLAVSNHLQQTRDMLINLIIGTNIHFLLFLWKLLPCVSWVQCMCVVTNIHILVLTVREPPYTHFSIDSKGPHTYIYFSIDSKGPRTYTF